MNIAALVSSYSNINELNNDFIYGCLSALAKQDPSVKILFITDKDFVLQPETTKNVQFLLSRPTNKQTIFRLYWNTFSLPKLIEDFGADVFLNDNVFSEKKNKAKKYIWVSHLTELKRLNKNIFKADLIISPNNYIKEKAEQIFRIAKEKLAVVRPGIDTSIAPVSFETKEKIKNDYTQGAEFFYFDGISATLDVIKKTLQSFSLFKKWQKSSMKMVIPVDLKKQEEFLAMLNNYKYREDVVYLIADESDRAEELLSVAYAALFLPEFSSLKFKMKQCLPLQIPLILSDNDFYRSSFADAVLYAKDDIETIAENMILIYKDETLRSNIILKGHELSLELTWKNAATELAKRIKEQE